MDKVKKWENLWNYLDEVRSETEEFYRIESNVCLTKEELTMVIVAVQYFMES